MTTSDIEWMQWPGLLSYPEAVGAMEARVAAIHEGRAPEAVWLVEHPSLYTAGTSANPADLLDARFPVYSTGRGGQYTYHGPGQRVAYVMLDLKRRQEAPDIKRYIRQLEEWIVRALGRFGIEGERRDGRVGIWVETQGGGEAKIAAIGVRVRHWVTYHGIAVNVDPDLSHFSGIVPCGIRGHGVTSIRELTGGADMAALDKALEGAWAEIFEEGAGARSESVR